MKFFYEKKTSKKEQKKHIINILKAEEESGLYDSQCALYLGAGHRCHLPDTY